MCGNNIIKATSAPHRLLVHTSVVAYHFKYSANRSESPGCHKGIDIGSRKLVTPINGGTSDYVATSAKYLIVKHSSTHTLGYV